LDEQDARIKQRKSIILSPCRAGKGLGMAEGAEQHSALGFDVPETLGTAWDERLKRRHYGAVGNPRRGR